MFSYQAFLWTKMPWFHQIFLIKIVSSVFEIFRKKQAKKPLFSSTITIHTLYSKVKIKISHSLFILILKFLDINFYVVTELLSSLSLEFVPEKETTPINRIVKLMTTGSVSYLCKKTIVVF